MNSSGWIRGYMSKNYSGEAYLIHVGTCIENQLKEWDNNYEVNIKKFADYEFVVKKGVRYYEMSISEEEVEALKNKGPYALDRKIWSALNERGLPILQGYGNYIERVL